MGANCCQCGVYIQLELEASVYWVISLVISVCRGSIFNFQNSQSRLVKLYPMCFTDGNDPVSQSMAFYEGLTVMNELPPISLGCRCEHYSAPHLKLQSTDFTEQAFLN